MFLGQLAATDLQVPTNAAGINVTGLAADSRSIKPGFLFAALPGSVMDGAGFATDAISRGAIAIVAATDATLPNVPAGVAVLRTDDPRRILARMASRFFPAQPAHLVAVTGTSGKTSVADFARQIFAATGHKAASIGTLGVVTDDGTRGGALTTPDAVGLHAELQHLAGNGITHAAVEASSHGLDQRRLDGLNIEAAGFTNLGRDHLDYHSDMDSYFAAKLRLFSDLLPPDGTAVVDMDDKRSAAIVATATARGNRVIGCGRQGRELALAGLRADGFGQHVEVSAFGKIHQLTIGLPGAFQVSNALVAAGLAIAAGVQVELAVGALEALKGAPGRLELVGHSSKGAMVFVDYAHKPEAITHVLMALRPMTQNRLIIVIGAGGDRDHGKRPLMGQAASAGADIVIVTDDNPRSEDPAAIRREILGAAPGAREIGDRGEAVAAAVAMLEAGDVLCVAGKGHETGQIVAGRSLSFSDREAVSAALSADEAA
jgi:UDP-N-acetylmuramoyl-L-alanyl-D-glutamate--2,6-diaminopimelate ligase